MSSELIINDTKANMGVAVDESTSMLAMISRAASDPTVDVTKMERLMAMHREMKADQARVAYAAAMALMQPKLPVIQERGRVQSKYQYALWEDVQAQIKPVLAEHGFALTFRTRRDGDQMVVTAVLTHRDGHSDTSEMPVTIEKAGGMNLVQAQGSAVSYGQRYSTKALLNLTFFGDDDDGRYGGGTVTLTDDQTEEITQLVHDTGSNLGRVLEWCGLKADARTCDIPQPKYASLASMLKARLAKKGQA